MSGLMQRLLRDREYLICDGAMGTALFTRGLRIGNVPDLWCLSHPEDVAAVHREFVYAGADIILTNSFGANAVRLKASGAEHRVAEINATAAALARGVAAATERPIVVAGSIGPTGERHLPDKADRLYSVQAEALAGAGVDVLWIETMSSLEELECAAGAATRTGLPVVATMSFEADGRTITGIGAAEAAAFANDLPTPLLSFGANCGVGPDALIAALQSMKGHLGEQATLVAKGNGGLPVVKDGRLVYDLTEARMALYARQARDAGARIVGGCCGTTPAHIRAIKAALNDTVEDPSPLPSPY